MSTAITVSFEVFPPADEAGARQLSASLRRLAALRPCFVSVTHGADGSSRARTAAWVRRIARETGLVVVPHLTCVGASRVEVIELAREYWRAGIRRVVALRGDPPANAESPESAPRARGFEFAADLVHGLKAAHGFDIAVAAYPEGHPESGTVEADIDNLKRKIEAGADRAITQFFFDTDVFLRYRDRCRAAGIDVPIVPGILPIGRFAQLTRFAARCGAAVPGWLARLFDGLDDDPETGRMIAAHVAIEQVRVLRRHGVEDFHFYTLNRPELTYAVCHAAGLRPQRGRVEAPQR